MFFMFFPILHTQEYISYLHKDRPFYPHTIIYFQSQGSNLLMLTRNRSTKDPRVKKQRREPEQHLER